MADDFRGGTDDGLGGYAAQLHRIVRHQTVTALDQLNSRLALTHTGVAEDQNTLTVYLHQHAVPGDAGRQLHVQKSKQSGGKGAGRLYGMEHRHLEILRQLQKLLRGNGSVGEHHRHGMTGKECGQTLAQGLSGQALQIGVFRIADDLHALRFKMLEKSCQRQTRTSHVGQAHHDLLRFHRKVHGFQFQFLYNAGQINGVGHLKHRESSGVVIFFTV